MELTQSSRKRARVRVKKQTQEKEKSETEKEREQRTLIAIQLVAWIFRSTRELYEKDNYDESRKYNYDKNKNSFSRCSFQKKKEKKIINFPDVTKINLFRPIHSVVTKTFTRVLSTMIDLETISRSPLFLFPLRSRLFQFFIPLSLRLTRRSPCTNKDTTYRRISTLFSH